MAAAKRHARQALGLPLAVVSTVAVVAAPLLASSVHAQAEPAAPEAVGSSSAEDHLLSLGAPAARPLGFPAGAELRLGDHLARWSGAARSIEGAGNTVHPQADDEVGSFAPGVYRMSTATGSSIFHPYHQSGLTIHIAPGGYQVNGAGFPHGGFCSGYPGTPQPFHNTVTSHQRVHASNGVSYEIHTVTYITATPGAECAVPGWSAAPPPGSPSAGTPPHWDPGLSDGRAPGPRAGTPPATTEPDQSYRPGWPAGPSTPPAFPPPTSPAPPPTPPPAAAP